MRYLNDLGKGLLVVMKCRHGRETYYHNLELMALLANPPDMDL